MTEKVEPLFYTVEQTVDRLQISRQKLYEYLRSGELPSALVGRKRLFLVTDVEAFATGLVSTDFKAIDNNQSKEGAS